MSNSPATLSSELSYLLSPKAIRERTRALYELALSGKTNFKVNSSKLSEVSKFVTEVTLENYPSLKIPFHSRWGHFQVGKVDRLKELEAGLRSKDPRERTRAKYDLAIVSVLLDAGAGPDWKYQESQTGKTWDRSEGLAVASFRMFMNGEFSSDPGIPLQVDARKLQDLSLEALARGFQVSPSNPLAGLEGRLKLLRELGKAVDQNSIQFPRTSDAHARPGNLSDYLISKGAVLDAPVLLLAVLQGLGPIWPGRLQLGGVNLGDVWSHPLLGPVASTDSYVPFHKLSQWLTYSLIEPLIEAGVQVQGVEKLTGLAEYRNGGLLLDRGLIELRDPSKAQLKHEPGSPLIIEWRALTVVLLDQIAAEVQARLKLNEKELPLAKVLEGGTWWAGRRAAATLRANGSPPLQIMSDGTVF